MVWFGRVDDEEEQGKRGESVGCRKIVGDI